MAMHVAHQPPARVVLVVKGLATADSLPRPCAARTLHPRMRLSASTRSATGSLRARPVSGLWAHNSATAPCAVVQDARRHARTAWHLQAHKLRWRWYASSAPATGACQGVPRARCDRSPMRLAWRA